MFTQWHTQELDLTTTKKTLEELDKLNGNTLEIIADCNMDIQTIREFILDWYNEYYEYIVVKDTNLYKIYYTMN
jgi:TusA-related sulfurtransferase